jgi:nitroreductase
VTLPTTTPVTLDDFAELARARRTHMLVDQTRDVPAELIDRLCEVATWAPNHKRTWPWKFASCTGQARYRLGEAFVTDMVARDFGDEGKRTKTATKYARTPAVLVVGCEPHVNPSLHDENRDAVAAAVQNLLLAATAAGLASFWSTAPLIDSEHALAFCGFEPDDRIVALIYLGWPVSSLDPPQRPAPEVTHLD